MEAAVSVGMERILTTDAMSAYADTQHANGMRIAFVPTMGALHEGHLSLIEEAKSLADKVVVSIFVNPTQFNNPDDLKHYPRNLEQDLEALMASGVDVAFTPEAEEVYQNELPTDFNSGPLGRFMEGEGRAGHFEGVVQVLTQLFSFVKPDISCFGEKDFQQLRIVEAMVAATGEGHVIHRVPTSRENDGLARSSRNVRLNQNQRTNAAVLYQCLLYARNNYRSLSVEELHSYVERTVNELPDCELEYFKIAAEATLEPLSTYNSGDVRAFIAARVGPVRLIDNLALNS